MRKGWEIKKLSQVCEIGDGNHSSKYPKSSEMVSQGIPFIRSNNLVNGEVSWNDMKFITREKHAILKKGHLKSGDVLFTNRGEIGKIAIVGQDFENANLNSQIAWFRCKHNLVNQYLYYYLLSPAMKNHYLIEKNGAALQQFTIRLINNIEINIPPLPEQQRIVTILDEAFAAIDKAKANAEKNLKNAKELFESYLQGVFENKGEGWEEKKLGDLCETGAGGTPLKSHKDYYQNGNIPWLRSGEVNKRDIEFCELFITEKGLKNSSAKLFPENTVLIAMYGATAGQVGILRFKCSTNQAVCGILPNDKILPEFVYYKFLAGKEVLVAQAVGGAQPNISQLKIKNTLVPFISLENQRIIVDKLDALSAKTKRLESIYQQKLSDLEELKKSILQKAFNGELNTGDICV